MDKDIWGRPYKIVMKTVKGRTSKLEVLSLDEVKEVVDKLFIAKPEPVEVGRHAGLEESWKLETEKEKDNLDKYTQRNGSMSYLPRKKVFSNEEVRKMAVKMSIKKAPGPDRVTSAVAKEIGCSASKWLTHIFSTCYKHGYWPAPWKIGRLVLLSKGSAKTIEDRVFRPLSIISCIAKILEKLVKTKILENLKRNDLS